MRVYLCVMMFLSLLFFSCKAPEVEREEYGGELYSLTGMDEYFLLLEKRYGKENPIKEGRIPLVFARNLPESWQGVAAQPDAFIELLLPEVARVNMLAAEDRRHLQALQRAKELSAIDKEWLTEQGKRYNCAADLDELLARVDIVPASLVLAQAILESGWGKSRFAREGNALYGEHRPKGSDKPSIKALYSEARVAAFPTLFAATKSYVDNLNSHRAYKELRMIRQQARVRKEFPDSYLLATGLADYSELGEKYVESLHFLIRRYKLQRFDQMTFEESKKEITVLFVRKNK